MTPSALLCQVDVGKVACSSELLLRLPTKAGSVWQRSGEPVLTTAKEDAQPETVKSHNVVSSLN